LSCPLFFTCARGLEPLLREELAALGLRETHERAGGVAARGRLEDAYRACLWSRLASRALLPLAQFELRDAESLYAGARELDWPHWFAVERSFAIEVAGRAPAIAHTHFAALRVKDAVADRFRETQGRRPDVDAERPDVRIHLHLHKQQATLSLDLSGESLHRRGYRAEGGSAPLKENLAAAILLRSGWPQFAAEGRPLIDPMCGSGTLVIEAALMAADIAPGLGRRDYGFLALNEVDRGAWQVLIAQAEARKQQGLARLPPLLGSDIDAEVLRAAQANARRAGLGGRIEWRQADVSAARPIGELAGLVVGNPPYGERLGGEAELIKLYSLLGATLKQHFGGWRAALFTARPELGPRLGLRAEKLWSFYNGDLLCKLLLFEVPRTETRAEPAPDLANRLRKNWKHLARWARREGVSCYRVYDADLPDYAVAVDLYPGDTLQVHVQEYAAPKTVDPVRAERRLREALSVIQSVFEVPAASIHFKTRTPQKGDTQYTRQSQQGVLHQVEEHGCKLYVNLDDYLDTGLFLDHRPLRRRIQDEAGGKRFLNLFCYTASATVHAVRGGAAASCSLDLSANYLEWARRNLELNGCAATVEASGAAAGTAWRGPRTRLRGGHAHRLVRADCLVWLREQAAAANPAQYDLILCDPPTFSNSKRMDDTLDVQRDHVELIRNCAHLLAPGGTLYFSTNRRRFKLDQEALRELSVTDITARTLDEDFRRPPPAHRCWMIRHPAPAAGHAPDKKPH
jgi:23S rRNA (guanine2445-N2)-methyltransferase / 23S rRNA (guanine2069-N7)-methyltransferase